MFVLFVVIFVKLAERALHIHWAMGSVFRDENLNQKMKDPFHRAR
jgi:hypothetical protein